MLQTGLLLVAYIQVVLVGVTLPQTTGEGENVASLSVCKEQEFHLSTRADSI